MAKKSIKNYTLYKLRFWLGYSILASLIAATLLVAALHTPGGLTEAEQQSAVTSAAITLDEPSSAFVVDLPYHALQKLSITLLGLSELSIKLPSLIIAGMTIVGMMFILSRRFTHTVSILAAGMVVVSAKFISLASSGTPEIMMAFWPVALLSVAMLGVKQGMLRPWAIVLGAVVAALSLLTPFSYVLILAICMGAALHPRVRYILRRTSRSALGIAATIVLASIGMLAYMGTRDGAFLAQLLYKSDSFSLDILNNLQLLGLQLGDITSASTTQTGLLTPVFGIGVIAIGLVGTVALLRARHTALSYMLFTWTILLTPLFILNPDSFSLLIVPMALFLAVGTSALLQYWYRLFPFNPYARFFALIPVAILFSCIIIPSAFRYFYSYSYFEPLANTSNNDLTLVARSFDTHPDASLAVTPHQEAFYRVYLQTHDMQNKLIVVDTDKPQTIRQIDDDTLITTRAASSAISSAPSYIIGNASQHTPSDRLYIYKISGE